jgi:recombinational DNA repair protein RecT
LSLSPSLGHAYLVPYGKTCSFSPGYKGIVHLFYRGGTLSRIQPGLHIEGDPKFKVWTDETGSHLVHEEAATPDRSNKKTLHSYVIAKLANGETIVTTMDREALLKVEFVATHKRERQNGKSVWVDNPRSGMVWRGSFRSQMEIKAVIRRASNYWPRDAGGHVEHAIEVMDKHDPVQFEPEPVEAEGQELLINEDQQLELHAALTDLGIESERASEWLRKKSQALGFASMDQLPQRLFETTKASLVERAKTYLKRAEELQRLESQQ